MTFVFFVVGYVNNMKRVCCYLNTELWSYLLRGSSEELSRASASPPCVCSTPLLSAAGTPGSWLWKELKWLLYRWSHTAAAPSSPPDRAAAEEKPASWSGRTVNPDWTPEPAPQPLAAWGGLYGCGCGCDCGPALSVGWEGAWGPRWQIFPACFVLGSFLAYVWHFRPALAGYVIEPPGCCCCRWCQSLWGPSSHYCCCPGGLSLWGGASGKRPARNDKYSSYIKQKSNKLNQSKIFFNSYKDRLYIHLQLYDAFFKK